MTDPVTLNIYVPVGSGAECYGRYDHTDTPRPQTKGIAGRRCNGGGVPLD